MLKEISYTLKKSRRARRVRLVVYCDGRVILTTPFGVNQSIVEKFLADKKKWLEDKINFFKNLEKRAIRVFSKEDYLKYKKEAFLIAQDRIKFFSDIYGFSPKKINIKNQKTRWGSCSRKKNININYKIIFLPEEQRGYIIAHEVCHLKEFNHSHKFWELLEKTIPSYLKIKKDLRNNELFYR